MIQFSLTTLRNQKGYLLVVAMLLIMLIGFMGAVITNMYYGSTWSSTDHGQADTALYLAESGIEQATHRLLNPIVGARLTCAQLTSSPITNAFGKGTYNVTAVASGINCAITSTAGIPNLTSPLFMRTLKATILIPASGRYGLLGGNVSAAPNLTLAQWNTPTVSSWNIVTATPAFSMSIYGISLTSSTDGWIVGSSTNFLCRWNGIGTDCTYPFPITSHVILRAVFCTSSNNCIAVGDRIPGGTIYGSKPCLLLWNGPPSWTQMDPGAGGAKNGLSAIHCNSPTNCWAVGIKGQGQVSENVFYQFNGVWNAIRVDSGNGFNSNAININDNYNGVFCNSDTDCWAVGTKTAIAGSGFARLSGTTWLAFTTSLTNSVYNAITCTATNDCWAVGNANAIAHWSGASPSWTNYTLSPLPSPTVDFNSIACTATECWAVGVITGGTTPKIFRYTAGAWSEFSTYTGTPPTVGLNAVSFVSGSTAAASQPITLWAEVF